MVLTSPSGQTDVTTPGRSRRCAEVIIVGAGLSGIAAAVRLREAGISDLLIMEKSQRVGGTWRENTYPGCVADIPSAVYSFTFEPNPQWTRLFPGQAEILRYIERTVTKYALADLLWTDTELLHARWLPQQLRWELTTNDGQFSARHVIFATGVLDEPHVPDIPGLAEFPGHAFHSARWNHGVELAGKRIAVVGTGSSAAQMIPELQRLAGKLYVFQRTPSWVIPRPDFGMPISLRRVMARSRFVRWYVRWIFGLPLVLTAFVVRDARLARAITPLFRWILRRQVPDPVLCARLIPDYTLGCKRLILSNDYYAALGADNVELLPHALSEVRGRSAVAANGSQRDVDVIVFGSGFELRHPPIADRIRGRDGRLLSEIWDVDSPRAYRGTTVPNIPNAYFLLGPNMVTYNSLLRLAEWQTSYIIGAIRTAEERDIEVLEVRPDVFSEFNRRLTRDIASSAYNKGGCQSYYLDENGRNFLAYPWSARTMRRSLRRFDIENYWTPRRLADRNARCAQPVDNHAS